MEIRQFLLSLSIAFSIGNLPTAADVAPDPASGGVSLSHLTRDKTSVEMKDESVDIIVTPAESRTHAVFHMVNPSKTVTMEVGFPSHFKGEYKDFAVKLNGVPMSSSERKITESEPYGGEHDVFWKLWRMPFKSGREETIDVSYKSATIEELPALTFFEDRSPWYRAEEPQLDKKFATRRVLYTLCTGSPWAGPIGLCTITMKFEGMATDQVLELSPVPTRRTAHELKWELKQLQPTENIHVRFLPNARVHEIAQTLQSLLTRFNDPNIATALGERYRLRGNVNAQLELYDSFVHAWDRPFVFFGKQDSYQQQEQSGTVMDMARTLLESYDKSNDTDKARSIAKLAKPIFQQYLREIDKARYDESTKKSERKIMQKQIDLCSKYGA